MFLQNKMLYYLNSTIYDCIADIFSLFSYKQTRIYTQLALCLYQSGHKATSKLLGVVRLLSFPMSRRFLSLVSYLTESDSLRSLV